MDDEYKYLQYALDATIVMDLEGKIIFFNRSAEEVFGYKLVDVVGKDLAQVIIPQELREAHKKGLQRFLNTGERKVLGKRIEITALHHSGNVFPVELSVIQMGEGKTNKFIGYVRDISSQKEKENEIKQHEQNLKEANLVLQEQNKQLEITNRELAQFAFVASHDLKSPLLAIQRLGEWIENDCGQQLPETARHHFDLLKQRVVRMQNLLSDLLLFSRIRHEEYSDEAFILEEVIQKAFALNDPPDTFRLEMLNCDIEISLPKTPFELATAKLISNAIKHHDRGEGTITVSYSIDGGEHLLMVTDDGPGIPLPLQEKAFEMFHTLNPRDTVEGSGLGLPIVVKAVEQFGGRVDLVSTGMRGTSAHLHWPLNKLMPQGSEA